MGEYSYSATGRNSTLARAQCESGDKLLLQHQIDHQCGDGGHDGPGRNEVVVLGEDTVQVVDAGRDGEPVAALDEQQCPEEVVVDPDELQRGQCRESRSGQRHDDLPVLAEDTSACLLYTSDAAADADSVDLGGRP